MDDDMQILYDNAVWVHYGQLYVAEEGIPDMTEAFAGQSNGLCGAGVRGELFLMTGTHTGTVWLTVELHDDEPPTATSDWEEVVEASFAPGDADVRLTQWAGERSWPLDLGGGDRTFRVRYCAQGMEQARESEATDGPAPDRYLLQFWPTPDAAARPDAVLRQTSGEAAYWHGYARRLPPPPTPEQRAEAERRGQLERERREEEYRLREEAHRWGGRPPTERLRGLDGRGVVTLMARLDRDLVDDVAAAEPGTQRRIARWAARRAYAVAGIADLDWMTPASAALERGEPLPEPFTDSAAMWRRITGQDAAAGTRVVGRLVQVPLAPTTDLSYLGVTPLSAALKALTDAALPDPLEAALAAIWTTATAYGAEAAVFLAEVRQAFPDVARDHR